MYYKDALESLEKKEIYVDGIMFTSFNDVVEYIDKIKIKHPDLNEREVITLFTLLSECLMIGYK